MKNYKEDLKVNNKFKVDFRYEQINYEEDEDHLTISEMFDCDIIKECKAEETFDGKISTQLATLEDYNIVITSGWEIDIVYNIYYKNELVCSFTNYDYNFQIGDSHVKVFLVRDRKIKVVIYNIGDVQSALYFGIEKKLN
jgi:hypothetical protein